MKKLLLALLIGIAGIGLVACDITQEIPEDDIIVEETPGEDDDKEETPGEEDKEPEIDEEDTEPEIDEDDEDITYEDNVIIDESNLVRGEFKTVTLDVKGYKKIKITIVGEYDYDIPVNINNFVVDGEAVEYSGITGTSYVVDFDFKIGNLDAVANLMNTHEGDIRLHTEHHTLTDPHSLVINVEDVSEISFDYRVTTAAYEYIYSLNIGMAAMEPVIDEEIEEPIIDEEIEEPVIDEVEPEVDPEDEVEPEVDPEDEVEPEVDPEDEAEPEVDPEDEVDPEPEVEPEAEGTLLIYEVYGGGGNSGSVLMYDYVVLYNGTTGAIDMSAYSLQYDSAASTAEMRNINVLSGTLAAGKFYVAKMAKGSGGTADLPRTDFTGNLILSGTSGRIALVKGSEAIINQDSEIVVDYVGFGTSSTFEGAAPTDKISATNAARRKNFIDTNDNGNDFEVVTADLAYLLNTRTE